MVYIVITATALIEGIHIRAGMFKKNNRKPKISKRQEDKY